MSTDDWQKRIPEGSEHAGLLDHQRLTGATYRTLSPREITALAREYVDAIAETERIKGILHDHPRVQSVLAQVTELEDKLAAERDRADRAEARCSSMMAERDDAREHVANWIAEADRERIIASRERAARAELERTVRAHQDSSVKQPTHPPRSTTRQPSPPPRSRRRTPD